jgi:hypothetical protein
VISPWLSYDPAIDAWIFDNRGRVFRGWEDVPLLEWRLRRELERLKGARASFLVSLAGMTIGAGAAGLYGRVMRPFIERHADYVVRYGGSLRTVVATRVAASTNGFTPEIHRSRDAAVARLYALRAAGAAPAL